MVFFTHRHAAAGQNQVVVLGCGAQRGFGGFAPIGHDAQVADLTAQALQQRTQEKPVGVVNGARLHGLGRNLAGHDQLIASREQGHAGARRHFQACQANAGGQAQGRG